MPIHMARWSQDDQRAERRWPDRQWRLGTPARVTSLNEQGFPDSSSRPHAYNASGSMILISPIVIVPVKVNSGPNMP